jgi:molybdate/tungstate transport system substrate-binding protein
VAQTRIATVDRMIDLKSRSGRRFWPLLVITCACLVAAACSSSSSSPASTSSPQAGSSTASVAYAASLEFLNEKIIGPAFTNAKGFGYSGRAGPSDGLESEIASHEISPNVFQAIGGDNITPLFPKFTTWYVQYAATSIVVAYNPKSKYAPQFEAIASGKKPITDLFTLMEKPGFLLGRTDPNLDPQGRAFIYMLELAQMKYHLPKDTVTKIIGSPINSSKSNQIYDEAALEPRLEAAQLDASSAYLSQARQLHLHYIMLPAAINLGDASMANWYHNASITITGNVTKHGSPLVVDITTIGKPTSAGTAYVAYVLSPAGRALYTKGGYTLLTPTAFGTKSDIPAAVSSELSG